jgi:hypothetical protein
LIEFTGAERPLILQGGASTPRITVFLAQGVVLLAVKIYNLKFKPSDILTFMFSCRGRRGPTGSSAQWLVHHFHSVLEGLQSFRAFVLKNREFIMKGRHYGIPSLPPVAHAALENIVITIYTRFLSTSLSKKLRLFRAQGSYLHVWSPVEEVGNQELRPVAGAPFQGVLLA